MKYPKGTFEYSLNSQIVFTTVGRAVDNVDNVENDYSNG